MIRLIIRKCDEYFLVKVFNEYLGDFNIFDTNDIKNFFSDLFKKLIKKYGLHGLIDAYLYINNDYGMIIELYELDSYFDDIDVKININFNNLFLSNIDSKDILDYDDVYYYEGKFYGKYKSLSDNEVLYKNTEDVINKGIKVK